LLLLSHFLYKEMKENKKQKEIIYYEPFCNWVWNSFFFFKKKSKLL